MLFDEVTRFTKWHLEDITPEPDEIAGVYFLIALTGDVVYVGQSIHPRARVAEHASDGKEFAEARLLPVREKELDEVELAFIHLFAPALNLRVPKMDPATIAKVVRRYGIEADEYAIKSHPTLAGPVRLEDAAKRMKISEDELRGELNSAGVRIRYSPSLDCLVVGKSDFAEFTKQLEAEKRDRAPAEVSP